MEVKCGESCLYSVARHCMAVSVMISLQCSVPVLLGDGSGMIRQVQPTGTVLAQCNSLAQERVRPAHRSLVLASFHRDSILIPHLHPGIALLLTFVLLTLVRTLILQSYIQ